MTTAEERAAYRRNLLAMVERLRGGLTRLEADVRHGLGGEAGGGLSDVPTHMADLGSANSEEEISLTLMANEERDLRECADALARLDAGTYGLCEECGAELPRARLEVFPHARYCLSCASRPPPHR